MVRIGKLCPFTHASEGARVQTSKFFLVDVLLNAKHENILLDP